MNQLGEKWPRIARDLNVPNTVNVRINTLKANKEDVVNELKKVGIELIPHPVFPNALYLNGRPRLNHIPAFQSGLFEVQDADPNKSVTFKSNARKIRVTIDACAGAGGKTLLLGELMRNQGRLIAMDVEGRKLGELKSVQFGG